MVLLVHLVVVGRGTRLFPAGGPDGALEPVGSRAVPGGVTLPVSTGPPARPRYAAEVPDRTS
ncbi:hypothetical protein [Streptomyces sp. NPDC096105]|uniref:hypothetical protein n=1 Tax=Streptomyces sp. NPDC096105 TaxID=3366074 RepID=UPI00381B43C1